MFKFTDFLSTASLSYNIYTYLRSTKEKKESPLWTRFCFCLVHHIARRLLIVFHECRSQCCVKVTPSWPWTSKCLNEVTESWSTQIFTGNLHILVQFIVHDAPGLPKGSARCWRQKCPTISRLHLGLAPPDRDTTPTRTSSASLSPDLPPRCLLWGCGSP